MSMLFRVDCCVLFFMWEANDNGFMLKCEGFFVKL